METGSDTPCKKDVQEQILAYSLILQEEGILEDQSRAKEWVTDRKLQSLKKKKT